MMAKASALSKLRKKLVVEPGQKVNLSKHDPDETFGIKSKDEACEALAENIARLAKLQYLMFAENKHALLIVLQAIDAGGKDGTIRHVMMGVNPQGCTVTAFKVPSAEEADHDFLWRIHRAVPPRGDIGIFNRSHYEDVLVVRVHELVPESIWSARFEQINDFEKVLVENNVTILKFFLHISKEEQRMRILARLRDPEKNWKFTTQDLEERKRWDDYMKAYEDAIGLCSKRRAPWFIIPANKKWFRNLAVSQIIVETLEDMKMKFPPPSMDLSKVRIR